MASIQTDRITNLTTQSSLAIKAPCRAATTADINSALTGGAPGSGGGGPITKDGGTLNPGDRVLAKNPTPQPPNGISGSPPPPPHPHVPPHHNPPLPTPP